MKNIFYTTLVFCVLQLSSVSAQATEQLSEAFTDINRTEYLYGRGYSSGFCQGDSFADFCYRQIKVRAEIDAKRDVEYQCRSKQGQLSTYGNCNTLCNPYFPLPGRDEFVTCNARCTYNCEISE